MIGAGGRTGEDDECRVPIGVQEQALTGESITVKVANNCEVSKASVMFADYPDRLPPPGTELHSLEPGERARMTIDPAQWFLNWTPGSDRGSAVQTSTEGSWIEFSGEGDECGSISARAADYPEPR